MVLFNIDPFEENFLYNPLVILLLVQSAANLLFEYGELCANKFGCLPTITSAKRYITNVWNILDCGALLAIAFWIGLTCNGHIYAGYSSLAISNVFMSIDLLRYLSVVQEIGEFNITLLVLSTDLYSYCIVFALLMFGFCVLQFSLFGKLDDGNVNSSFSSSGQTFLTMLSAALGNYDNEYHNAFPRTSIFRKIGVALQVIYIIFFSIVILNIVIARMASTYKKVNKDSFQKWQLSRAQILMDYILLEERSAMLVSLFKMITLLIYY